MDGWDIADALLLGRAFPRAKLRTISNYGDGADRLYVWLFEATIANSVDEAVFKAVRRNCSDQPTAEAWVNILRYAGQPTGQNYARLAKAVRKMDDTAEAIIRLAPLALIRKHRRRFAQLVEHAACVTPAWRSDLTKVAAELKQNPGPARLVSNRSRTVLSNVR